MCRFCEMSKKDYESLLCEIIKIDPIGYVFSVDLCNTEDDDDDEPFIGLDCMVGSLYEDGELMSDEDAIDTIVHCGGFPLRTNGKCFSAMRNINFCPMCGRDLRKHRITK